MALSAASMKTDIISALSNVSDTANNACKKFGDAILENICREINVSYRNTSGTYTITVSGFGTLTPSPTFEDMLLKLAVLIKGLSHSSPSPGFNLAGALTVDMGAKNTQDSAMQTFCEQVISSIKATFPVASMTIM